MDTERLISTFCELVKIPSESPDDKEFISHVEKFLRLEGAKTRKDAYGNLVVKFLAKNSKSKTPIAFCCHADTVKPGVGIKPIVDREKGIIRTDGTTILGADDKAGIAEIIEMIRAAEKHPPIEIIITRCEEIGSVGAKNLDFSLIESKMAYVLDMDGPQEVVIGEATHIHMDVTYTGRAAHSGVEPEKGISSIQAAVRAIYNMKLGRIDASTTANVGVFQGGEARNSVPEVTKLMAECRSLDDEKAFRIADEMKAIFTKASDEVGTKIDIVTDVISRGYKIPENSPIVELFLKALKKHNVKPDVQLIVAGTDASLFNEKGVAAVVVGVGCRDIHSKNEQAIISEMETTTNVLITLVEDLA
ncbi:MAG: M20/M25/M40 family metallo-hydrolase [bacterium]